MLDPQKHTTLKKDHVRQRDEHMIATLAGPFTGAVTMAAMSPGVGVPTFVLSCGDFVDGC
jgi:hypothetical protein